MTHEEQSSNASQAVQLLAEHGFEGMVKAIEILFNEAMKLQRQDYLGAAPYERSDERRAYANGFKPKTVNSRLGSLSLQVPQARDGKFCPSVLEKGEQSEKALKLAVAEMYVQGVSTHKVAEIPTELCGLDVTSTQVSRAAAMKNWMPGEIGHFKRWTISFLMHGMKKSGGMARCVMRPCW